MSLVVGPFALVFLFHFLEGFFELLGIVGAVFLPGLLFECVERLRGGEEIGLGGGFLAVQLLVTFLEGFDVERRFLRRVNGHLAGPLWLRVGFRRRRVCRTARD